MAARLPVIATDVGGNHETVVNGQTGFLVPPRRPAELAETLIRMLRDPALRGRMGQAGRQRVVENFSQPLMHQKYLDLYVALSERGAGS